MRSSVLLPAVALLATTAACTHGPATTPAPQTSTTAPVATPPPTPVITSTPTTSTSDTPFVILKDKKGDGGGADITDVRIGSDADGLTVWVNLDKAAPRTGTFAVFLNLSSRDGETVRQLGMKWVDDEAIPPFSFDFDTSKQTNYDDAESEVEGKHSAALFPPEVLDGLGDSWRWQAVTSVEGKDEDFAPADGKKSDFPG